MNVILIEIKTLLQQVLMNACVVALGVVALAALARVCRGAGVRFRGLGPAMKCAAVAVGFVAALVAQKNGGGMFSLREGGGLIAEVDYSARMQCVTNGGQVMTRYNPWTVRGAAEDWFRFDFPEGWEFPFGAEHWTRAVALTSGEIWDTVAGANRIVAVGRQMGAVPFVSEFFWEHTPSNSLRLTWSGFFEGRDVEWPIDATLELMRNGDWVATTNGVAEYHEFAWPYGTTNSLPDAAEAEDIESWQYVLTARFPSNLVERVALRFAGDGAEERRYCIAAGGEYAFALEKGRLYEVTISRDEGVDFEWTDADGNGGCNRAGSLDFEQVGSGMGGDRFEFYGCRGGPLRRVRWRPRVEVSPGVVYVDDGGAAMRTELTADIALGGDVSYRWLSFNGEAEILGAASRRAWLLDANGAARLMVEARNDCYCATGEVEVVRRFAGAGGAGEGATNVAVSVAAREFVTVKRQAWGELAPVVFAFAAPEPTNGTLRLTFSGADAVELWDDAGRSAGTDGGRAWRLDGVAAFCVTNYLECGEASSWRDEAAVWLRWDGDGGESAESGRHFTVAEFAQEPVTTDKKNVGGESRIVNPSGAVRGEAAYLRAEVEYPLYVPDADIVWECESGAATFPNGNTGKDVAVVAQGDAPIVVSAYYRHYPERKMRFNLMPVEMRTVTVFPCEVLDRIEETPTITMEKLNQMLIKVNEIYRQVGLRFVATNIITVVNDNWSKNGLVNRATGAAIRNHMSNTGGLELYFIKGSPDVPQTDGRKEPAGAWNEYGVIVKKNSDATTIAHEIGHACGWCDIYVDKGGVDVLSEDISDDNIPDDKGYYSEFDGHADLVRRLLMFGETKTDKGDIPSGSVYGVRKFGRAVNASCYRTPVPVGLDSMSTESLQSR